MKRLLCAFVVLTGAVALTPWQTPEENMEAYSRVMTCAASVGDQQSYYWAMPLYNNAAGSAGYSRDTFASAVMMQQPLYVLEAIKESGGC